MIQSGVMAKVTFKGKRQGEVGMVICKYSSPLGPGWVLCFADNKEEAVLEKHLCEVEGEVWLTDGRMFDRRAQ